MPPNDTNGRLLVANNSLNANRVMRFANPVPALMILKVTITGKKKITTTLTRLKIKGKAFGIDGSVQLVQVKVGKRLNWPKAPQTGITKLHLSSVKRFYGTP